MAGREGKLIDLETRTEQKRLSKEELLRPRLVEEDVELAGLGGGTVRLRSISHRVRQELRQQCGFGTDKFDEEEFTMLSIIESVIDPQLTKADIEKLREQDATVIDELIVQISVLNMLGRAEDLKKDSEPTTNSDSASS